MFVHPCVCTQVFSQVFFPPCYFTVIHGRLTSDDDCSSATHLELVGGSAVPVIELGLLAVPAQPLFWNSGTF